MRLQILDIPKFAFQRRPSAVLGVLIIVILWAGVFIAYRGDVEQDYRDVEERNRNYTIVLEENVLRSIGEIDKALLYLRRTVELAQETTDYQTIVSTTDVLSEIIVQVAIIDARGISRGSNANPAPTQVIDISDREHFKFHLNSEADNLFISKPVIGRASGKWSVQFTRRFSNKDGSFAGIVVASMDPAHFTKFYNKVNIGGATSVAMIGSDGAVRSSGGDEIARLSLGQDLSGTKLFSHFQSDSDGVFRDPGVSPDDSLVITARKVREHPLWVTVSTREFDIYQSSWSNLKQNSLIVACLTALILIALEHLLRAEAKAVQKAHQLQLTLEHISQGIMLITKDRQIPIINQRCTELLLLPKQMAERPTRLDELAQYEADNNVPLSSQSEILSSSTPPHDFRAPSISDYKRPDGTFIEVRKTQLPDGSVVQTFTDITTRREAEASVAKLASEDPLTKLHNRRVFHSKLRELCESSHHGRFAVLFMDMDRFKVINDTLGHRVGDSFLVEVARRLRSVLRESDILSRLGGDEFAVLLSAVSSPADVEATAQRIVEAMSEPFQVEHQQISTSISIGIAMGPADGKTQDDLLVAADLALYAVKVGGRGAYRFYQRAMNDELNGRREVELDLRDALDHGRLQLYYQPIVDLQRSAITGFEALARWPHPSKGMISPAKFIPVAEDCGLINPLGNWALGEACRTAVQWPGDLQISVNVSPIQIAGASFLDTIARVLADTGLEPHRLALEFTERIFIEENEKTLSTLHKLKDIGVQIALDDFGTGYSSLSYLRRFPFDTVKIDRSFVADLGASTSSNVIVQGIILIAGGLGINTVAEGIERADQMQFLKALGCKQVQGYLLNEPVPTMKASILAERWMAKKVSAA
jgi:diguanylate cyclase (GGDEF)-like protein